MSSQGVWAKKNAGKCGLMGNILGIYPLVNKHSDYMVINGDYHD
jgi:hypothetical protein